MDEKPAFKYFDTLTALFTAVLIISNIVSAKIARFGPFNFDAGTVLFPLSYIFGDILTEVYGYKRSRKVIWTGFLCLIMLAITLAVVQHLPPAKDWPNQQAYETILGFVPRIIFASIIAYFLGEFSNSFVLAKMKIWTKGRHLWSRTIGSTIVGELADSAIFSLIAFYGTMPLTALLNIMGTIYIFKVLYEAAITPLTYRAVNALKKAEGVDIYDTGTDFNPFKLN